MEARPHLPEKIRRAATVDAAHRRRTMLVAVNGFGAGDISLPQNWQMMGVLQSLAGVLLFGFTTAFMFAMFQAVWPSQQQPDNE